MTQFDLGRLLGVSESRISKIETGRSQPDSAILSGLVELFDLDEKMTLELIDAKAYISAK
jgi:transcriptional regulator with XRE-family HTH domain